MSKQLSKLNWLLIFVLTSAITLSGQRVVTGVVTDANDDLPLIGANILVTGTNIGTITNIDGEYSIEVPADAVSLTVSYTGYETVVVTLTADNVVNVGMTEGTILEEVVVIGYGTVKREDATGSVQTVNTETFNRGAITGPQDLLSGKVAGVTISSGGGPGDGAAIRIRGESSLSASNSPLIVIDGMPLEGASIAGDRNPLNIINPNDIETFTVLKDASAAAIYGNRAAGGVILITTKKGSVGSKMKVSYNAQISVGQKANEIEVFNGEDFRNFVTENYPNLTGLLGNANTDWQEAIFQSAVGHDHNVSLAGAMGELPYRVSLGYTNKDGILRTDNFTRYTSNINITPGFMDNTLQLKFGLKSMFTQNTFADAGAIGNALGFDPTKPVLDSESPYGGYTTWTASDGLPNPIATTNPVALLDQKENTSDVTRYIASLNADYRFSFLPALRANLNLAYDNSSSEGKVFVVPEAAFEYNSPQQRGRDQVYFEDQSNSLLEFYLNYKKEYSRNDLDVMAGYSWQKFTFEDNGSAVYPTNNAEIIGSVYENAGEYYLLSLFGRINYSLDDKLLATFSLRRDATSRFAEDNRWGLFPAAALGYKLYDQPENAGLSRIKVRLGWGVTGQQEIFNPLLYLPQYQSSQAGANYQFGNSFVSTLRPNGYNSEIKWETTTTLNAAIDFGILRERVSGTIEVYQRNTEDLLNNLPVAAGTNLTDIITSNVGELKNNGIELTLNTTPLLRDGMSWDFGFNVAYNQNEITKLTATEDPNYEGVLTGGIAGGVGSTIQIHSVGHPSSSFYVFEQVYDEEGNPVEGLYVDRNGDGVVNTDDRYRYQQPAANYSAGFTSRFAYNDFDIAFAGRANIGNFIYNNVWSDQAYYDRVTNSSILWNINRAATMIDFSRANFFSDYFVRDASFLRVDHITLGYNLNEVLGDFARITLTVQNPFVITEYEGLDPEVFGGIDNNIYPRPRTLVLGLNVNF